MQFSNTTTKNALVQDCEFRLGFADAGISGNATTLDHFTRRLNENYYKVISIILEAMDEAGFDDPVNITGSHSIVTRALVANQRDYLFATTSWSLIGEEGAAAQSNAAISPLKITRVDICYDGVGNVCYRAHPIQSAEVPQGKGNDTLLDASYTKENPAYEVTPAGINVYPRANATNVTNGGVIRVEFVRMPDKFLDTDTTQEPAIDELFHGMISCGASRDYAAMKGLRVYRDLEKEWQKYEQHIKRHYGSKVADRIYVAGNAYPDNFGE